MALTAEDNINIRKLIRFGNLARPLGRFEVSIVALANEEEGWWREDPTLALGNSPP